MGSETGRLPGLGGALWHSHRRGLLLHGSYERGADGKEIDANGYANYEPIGTGVLPMPAILALLTPEQGFTGWINVELDGTARAPRPPRAAAAMSRQYLGQQLGDQAAWRQ